MQSQRWTDIYMESSATREYPSLIYTFFVKHTVNGVFTRDEDRAIYVNLMMKLFRSDDKFSQMLNQYESTPEFGNASGSGGCGDDKMAGDEDDGDDEKDEEDGDS
nr:hypothetical protein [Tanacetum cinerariifolium]